jgi:predicted RNase H-like HicB family nuclease
MNKQGYSFESVLNNGMQAIAVKTELIVEETGALIL